MLILAKHGVSNGHSVTFNEVKLFFDKTTLLSLHLVYLFLCNKYLGETSGYFFLDFLPPFGHYGHSYDGPPHLT